MESTTFPPETWSVYRQPFRTNNDVEGWHHRLNRANHAVKPNFYVLIQILHDEALDVEHTCEFLRSGVVMRRQRRQYAEVHRKIMDAWEQFATGHMTAHRLMRTCGRLSIPRIGQAATD